MVPLNLREIELREVWKEHVLAAVDWPGLREAGLNSLPATALTYIELFMGGSLVHNLTASGFTCNGCPFSAAPMGSPTCESHLGIIEAFFGGLTERPYLASRVILGDQCMICCQEIE
jgi:hypothetical protein